MIGWYSAQHDVNKVLFIRLLRTHRRQGSRWGPMVIPYGIYTLPIQMNYKWYTYLNSPYGISLYGINMYKSSLQMNYLCIHLHRRTVLEMVCLIAMLNIQSFFSVGAKAVEFDPRDRCSTIVIQIGPYPKCDQVIRLLFPPLLPQWGKRNAQVRNCWPSIVPILAA